MQIFRDATAPLKPADPATFAGPVRNKLLASSEEGAAVHLYRVHFDLGSRTNWHTHSGPQWLFIISGRVRVQRLGGPVEDVSEGDAVLFAPGEKHWHGAVPGSTGAHLAINVNVQTTWLEPVTDEDYNASRSAGL